MVDVESFFASSCVLRDLGLPTDVKCHHAGLLVSAFFAAPAGLPVLLHLNLLTNILPHEYLRLGHSLGVILRFQVFYIAISVHIILILV